MEEKLSIDEEMRVIKGRRHLKVYVRLKPQKYRYKLYLLCEEVTDYCYDLRYGEQNVKRKRRNYCMTY